MATKWIPVAQSDEVKPNNGIGVDVEGRDVALFRAGDEFFAIGNECPHQGAPLCDGYLEEGVVTCPWHGWEFQLQDGKGLTAVGWDVPSYQVKIENGSVFVAVEEG